MKVLYLLRHAESDAGGSSVRDFDRPLNERGRLDAALAGRFMREKGISPRLVVSSTAVRARQTAELISGADGIDVPVKYDAKIYEAHPQDLLKIVCGAEDSEAELLIVGHNPGLEELAARLTGERRRLTTAALGRIELWIERWRDAADGRGRFDWLMTPRDIEKAGLAAGR